MSQLTSCTTSNATLTFEDKQTNSIRAHFEDSANANLEGMIANILKSIIDKILNAAECLVENVIGGIIGNVLGNITGVINSILSKLGSVIGDLGVSVGAIIALAGDMLDFVISILDVFTCKADNICPDSSTWDFLQGSQPKKNETLYFTRILAKAKSINSWWYQWNWISIHTNSQTIWFIHFNNSWKSRESKLL